ncbi:MAG: hypothetical protein J6B95_08370 [Oscillospiraceae bacterium]|nr:hypothetical protein [Oscillospiraceae bacterium]
MLTLVLVCCALVVTVSAEELPQLPAPTDLEWDYDHVNDIPLPGAISWKGIGRNDVYYEVEVYCDGEWERGTRIYAFSDSEPVWYTWEGLAGEFSPESGTYTFTVTTYPYQWDAGYSKSEDAQSDEWIYAKPDKSLSTCTDVSVDMEHIYWAPPEDTSLVGGYAYKIFYSNFEEMNPIIDSVYKTVYSAEDAAKGIGSWDGPGSVHQSGSAGFYKVWVRLLSKDIRQANHGEWFILQDPFCYEFNGVGENAHPLLGRATITSVDENLVTWELPADSTYVGGYAMEVYFSEDPEATGRKLYYVGSYEGSEPATSCSWDPSEFQGFTDGYFEEGYFRIMVMMTTNNWSEASNSLWSALSEPFFYSYTGNGSDETVAGDMDGDGALDDKDVAQLLWHTLFPR